VTGCASSPSADAIDALLPQTQCRQCSYAGCRPYAEAIAAGRAGINQCPPGAKRPYAISRRCWASRSSRWPRSSASPNRPPWPSSKKSLHRLHAVHPGLPGRCHRRRRQSHAHRDRAGMHRLRAVHSAMPSRLHPDGQNGAPACARGKANRGGACAEPLRSAQPAPGGAACARTARLAATRRRTMKPLSARPSSARSSARGSGCRVEKRER